MNNNIINFFEKATGYNYEEFEKNAFDLVDDMYEPSDDENDSMESISTLIQEYIATVAGIDYEQMNELSSFMTQKYLDRQGT